MIDPNSPAFPFTPNLPAIGLKKHPGFGGMTIREYFAGLAMQGLLANPEVNAHNKAIAEDAVSYADSLIEALKGEK